MAQDEAVGAKKEDRVFNTIPKLIKDDAKLTIELAERERVKREAFEAERLQ